MGWFASHLLRRLSGVLAALALAAAATGPFARVAEARDADAFPGRADVRARADDVSPALRIRRHRPALPPAPPARADGPYRSFDGSGNNRRRPRTGQAGTRLLRLVAPDYADGVEALAGAHRPGARVVSNTMSRQSAALPNALDASDFLWQWGQFLDHDIDLTDGTNPPEPAPIPVPEGDPDFDPAGSGSAVIAFNRSVYDPDTGTHAGNPRQQINEISAWIDASNVYGSHAQRARALRALDGTGRLRTSHGGLLPFNHAGLPNAGGDGAHLFLAGDVRANENVGLTALHVLFVREHNRYADELRSRKPYLPGEVVYQRARRHVGALMQVITYQEYLPALLGRSALAPYRGYRAHLDASISNVFSTATYRYGHSALNPMLLRVDREGAPVPAGHLALRDAFFAPWHIIDGGIDPILRGLARQRCQQIDPYVIDDVRNFLFGPPGAGGFDLAALNVQRGRDHGLASYNRIREGLGLARKSGFRDVTGDPEIRRRLAATYASIDDVDAWVGALAEAPLAGAMVGELIHTVVKEQFESLRDGDRFWYERTLPRDEVRRLKRTRLADVIRRNTGIGEELGDDVFHVAPRRGAAVSSGRAERRGGETLPDRRHHRD